MDPDSDENFTHMVPGVPSNVFQMDPGDKVWQSALGIHLVSPPHLTYKNDLMEYSQDIMTKFVSAFYQAKNPEATATAEVTVTVGPVGTATHAEEVTMEVDSPSKANATDKCRVKSSMKEKLTPVDDSREEAYALVKTAGQMVDCQPEETVANTSVVTVTGGGDASNEPQVDIQTLNQAREMLFCLLKQSKILDKCRVQVARAIGSAVSRLTTQLFQPFTSYISNVSDAVEAWCTKVTLIHPEMSHCSYDTYCACSASIRERTNEFFGRLQDLNTTLDQQMLPLKPDQQTPIQSITPNDEGDSGLGSSVDATALGNTSTESDHNRDANPPETTLTAVAPVGKNDPFVVEVATIMEDVESSIQWYVQEVTKTVLQNLGGVEMTSYLTSLVPGSTSRHPCGNLSWRRPSIFPW